MMRFARVPLLASLCACSGLLLLACGDPGPPMRLVRIERDLLELPPTWETIRSREDAPPCVEMLCPAISGHLDGSDMPALVLAPPCEVRFEIGAESLPARLVARAGVDLLSERKVTAPLRVVFEIAEGERVLARAEVGLGQGADNVWVDLGGESGIEISRPTTLVLRTEALDAEGRPVALPFALRAGFGGLRLERRLERERARSSPSAPSVVLVVMDTLRADRLSCYGYDRPTSPRLAELAARGVLFEACTSSASWTWPATASILTGLTPLEHGVVSEAASYLLDRAETLPESLQAAGFATAAWSGNPIVSRGRNFDQGFERFWSAPEHFQATGTFFEEVRAFLREQAGRRFFLYLHLGEPHNPLRPLPEGQRLLAPDLPTDFPARSDAFWSATSKGQAILPGGEVSLDGIVSPEDRAATKKLYDACVWSGDHWLGALLDELAALGLEDETIVAFTSDHGEELFERGVLGHGQSLHSELVHVPLVLAGPGVPRDTRRANLVSSRMLAPLLADLAGVPFAGVPAADVRRARRALTDGEPGEDWALFTTTKGLWKKQANQRVLGMTDGRWKLEWAPHARPWGAETVPAEGDLELHRLDLDSFELHDLAPKELEEARRLRALLAARAEELEARKIGASIPAGAATLRALQELGYIGEEGEPSPGGGSAKPGH